MSDSVAAKLFMLSVNRVSGGCDPAIVLDDSLAFADVGLDGRLAAVGSSAMDSSKRRAMVVCRRASSAKARN